MRFKTVLYDHYPSKKNKGLFPIKIRITPNGKSPSYYQLPYMAAKNEFDSKEGRFNYDKRLNGELVNPSIAETEKDLEILHLKNAHLSAKELINLFTTIKSIKQDPAFSDTDQDITRFLGFIDFFIKQCDAGKIKREKNTIKSYYVTKGILDDFNKLSFFNFPLIAIDDYLNMDKYNSLVHYIRQFRGRKGGKGSTENTVGHHIKNVKTFIQQANDRNLCKTIVHRSKWFKSVTELTDAIFLSDDEIYFIYKLELTDKNLNHEKDRFILSACIGTRYSDSIRIEKDMIIKNKKGTFLNFSQTKKTKDPVIIPLKKMALDILKKYNYHSPPYAANYKSNLYLKEIGQIAAQKNKKFREKIVITKTINGKSENFTFEKCQLLQTHTARRSFATNAFLAGVPTISIMKIGGWKTEASFMRYIRIEQLQNAMLIASHPFFK